VQCENVLGNKRGIYRCVSSKRKTKQNEDVVLNWNRDLVTKDTKKDGVLNGFFDLVLAGKTGLQEAQALRPVGESKAVKAYPW